MTTVEALKLFYIKLGGKLEDVIDVQTDAEMIDYVEDLAVPKELPSVEAGDIGKALIVGYEDGTPTWGYPERYFEGGAIDVGVLETTDEDYITVKRKILHVTITESDATTGTKYRVSSSEDVPLSEVVIRITAQTCFTSGSTRYCDMATQIVVNSSGVEVDFGSDLKAFLTDTSSNSAEVFLTIDYYEET